MVDQSGDALAGREGGKDLSRLEGPSRGRELEIDFSIQGGQKLLVDRVASGREIGVFLGAGDQVQPVAQRERRGVGTAEAVNDGLGLAAGEVGAFSCPVVDPGEVGRAGFSCHLDRRIEIDQGLVETAVGLVGPG